MSSLYFGDMASAMRNMRLTSQVKQDLDKYTYEVASGVKQDLARSVSGDFNPLAAIERSIRTLESYDMVIQEAGLFASSMQTTLDTISTHVQELSTGLMTAATTADATAVSVAGTDARTRFDAIVSMLNTRIGDRSLFSGAATGSAALVSSEDMLTDLAPLVASATSVDDVQTIVEDWFNTAGGGYETDAYLGSDNALSDFALGENDSVRLDVTAQDQEIRDVLVGLAMASLVDEEIFAAGSSEQVELLQVAGQALMGAQKGVVDLQAKVGNVESRIEQANVANSSSKFAYLSAKSDIVTADPYEAASMLEQTQAQLQLIYTLTARMSNLTLADYIR